MVGPLGIGGDGDLKLVEVRCFFLVGTIAVLEESKKQAMQRFIMLHFR